MTLVNRDMTQLINDTHAEQPNTTRTDMKPFDFVASTTTSMDAAAGGKLGLGRGRSRGRSRNRGHGRGRGRGRFRGCGRHGGRVVQNRGVQLCCLS